MTLGGMGPGMVVEGGISTAGFATYVARIPAPTLRPGDIEVLDNLRQHRGERTRALIEARGAELRFLPAYAPDLNPIEEAFSKVKALLRTAAARTHGALLAAIRAALAAITPADAQGYFTHCGYPPWLNPHDERCEQRAFDVANARYHTTVDWALDISEAEFQEADLRGVPARLIRRDPATQVIVTREKALEGRWQDLDLSNTHWPVSLRFILEEGHEDVVLVARRRSRDYPALLKGLDLLREAGVAEPN